MQVRKRRLNIILVAPGFPPEPVGGGSTHAFYLAHALGSIAGVRVHVIAQNPSLGMHPFTSRVIVHRVKPGQDLGKPPFSQFLEKALRVAVAIRSRNGFNEHEGLLVHGQHWGGIFVALHLKHRFGLPVVATIHKTPIGGALGKTVADTDPSYCHFTWLATCPIDAFIAGSEFFYKELQRQIPNARIELIRHGVPEPWLRGESTGPRRQGVREKLKLSDADRLILCPVRWDSRKRVVDLVDAAGKLVVEMPREPLKFLITAGTDKKGHREIIKRARRAGLSEDRLLLGQLDFQDMAPAFRAANLVVYPTDREGLGISALEAMALERPVVATDAEGIREIITHEQDGYLYAAGEADHLAQIMVKLLREKSHASDIGKRAKEKVKTEFSHATMAQSYVNLYNSLLDQELKKRAGRSPP
ncbi:MAG: glycosyltransferase family 4 protein [Elusimicrobia bacterium]|nr:glycosyltransferase family 4 protein [Elusimicrobiota bacterium]